MDFRRNITRHIDNRFCYVRYGNLELIMLKENGFINATKLCNLANKKFRNWRQLKSAKDLIKTLSYKHNIRVIKEIGLMSDCLYRYELVGTYVHRDLIPYIISWAFPSVAIMYCNVINNCLTNPYGQYLRDSTNYFLDATCFDTYYNRKKNTKMVKGRYNYTNKLKEQNKILENRISKLEEKIRTLTTE
ncbi:SWPV1-092 [Shearwaterpox virus]|uniref:SWPV1-092 n=1 Tax=Shearwaterpox virus TaxID=1974596 RepID=A0A1V0S7U2_CNPV|nr:SWPV1-092 [Shearwaterpox virus]